MIEHHEPSREPNGVVHYKDFFVLDVENDHDDHDELARVSAIGSSSGLSHESDSGSGSESYSEDVDIEY